MFTFVRFPLWLAMVLGIIFVFGMRAVSAAPIDINTADAPTIARELKGIGLARARAIVEYRTKNGPFRSVDELALVKGLGPKTIANNRELIRTGRAAAPPSPRPARPATRSP